MNIANVVRFQDDSNRSCDESGEMLDRAPWKWQLLITFEYPFIRLYLSISRSQLKNIQKNSWRDRSTLPLFSVLRSMPYWKWFEDHCNGGCDSHFMRILQSKCESKVISKQHLLWHNIDTSELSSKQQAIF